MTNTQRVKRKLIPHSLSFKNITHETQFTFKYPIKAALILNDELNYWIIQSKSLIYLVLIWLNRNRNIGYKMIKGFIIISAPYSWHPLLFTPSPTTSINTPSLPSFIFTSFLTQHSTFVEFRIDLNKFNRLSPESFLFVWNVCFSPVKIISDILLCMCFVVSRFTSG